nr:DUF6273 domain-containing protein [Treponema sp.]
MGQYKYNIGPDYNYYYITPNTNEQYMVEPIKWRIVTKNYNNTGKALLVAENILIAGMHNAISWSQSDVRIFLTNKFLYAAFTVNAQTLIANTDTTLKGYVQTIDKVFILSKAEIENPEYGFSTTQSLLRSNTNYAARNNITIGSAGCYGYSWWLRDVCSSASSNTRFFCIKSGVLDYEIQSVRTVGVVPAIVVDLPAQ